MCTSDSRVLDKNIESINFNSITLIQKELSSYDLNSLVFLLYEGTETALERLSLLQRVARDVNGGDLNLLHDWAVASHQKCPNWRSMFLEALAITKLYGIVRKLGCNVSVVKSHFLPNIMHSSSFIHPMKKNLYHLFEHIDNDTFMKLKKTLLSHDIDVMECETCELVSLHLLKQKFISLESIEKLASIIESISSISRFASQLRDTQQSVRLNGNVAETGKKEFDTSNIITPGSSGVGHNIPEAVSTPQKHKVVETFEDTFELLNSMIEENLTVKELKTDKARITNSYALRDPSHVGVALIINQEKFYPSKQSQRNLEQSLDDRLGSTMDKEVLRKTLQSFNFDVYSADNVDSSKMIPAIETAIKKHFDKSRHSIFLLCILSHGFKGYMYAADSVAVEIEKIQDAIDRVENKMLFDIPKVMIIQACQANLNGPVPTLVADSPKYFLKRMDFLIYWAAAADYEAYRNEKNGTVFIQTLCKVLEKRGRYEQLEDIFKTVTDIVTLICAKNNKAQLPKVESTLRKKLHISV